jgi:SAM-dependent methyltransferase
MNELLACRVCGAGVQPLYRSLGEASISSSASILRTTTSVDACPECGHVQTQPISDLAAYYSVGYNFHARSAEEDDLCTSKDSELVYRSDLQAVIVETKLGAGTSKNVLDYGSGKARTLRLLARRDTAIQPHVFDVSDAYRPYWDEFVSRNGQASFTIPDDWRGRFDAVLSFFTLEHVERPAAFVSELRSLLHASGRAIVTLPNMYLNVSDFIVADHINHFSRASLSRLFGAAGFRSVAIDAETQAGWYVIEASVTGEPRPQSGAVQMEQPKDVASLWESLGARVRAAEERHGGRRVAIYGSGVYGLFMASVLREPGRIACFIDRNPYRHGLSFFGAKVVSPEDLPEDVRLVFVGLNPIYARESIASLPALAAVDREYFYV